MGFNLEDQNGEVGYGLNYAAWSAVASVLYRHKKVDFPELKNFRKNGVTENPKEFARECRRLSSLTTKKHVADTLKYLAQSAAKSKGFFALTM